MTNRKAAKSIARYIREARVMLCYRRIAELELAIYGRVMFCDGRQSCGTCLQNGARLVDLHFDTRYLRHPYVSLTNYMLNSIAAAVNEETPH